MFFFKSLFFLLLGGMIVSSLFAHTSLNKKVRVKASIFFLATAFIQLCLALYGMVYVFNALTHNVKTSFSFLDIMPNNLLMPYITLMLLTPIIPHVIGYIYIQVRFKRPIFRIQYNWVMLLILFLVLSFFAVVFLQPNIASISTNGKLVPVYDARYYQFVIYKLCFFIPAFILYVFMFPQGSVLYKEGLSYSGKFWAWNDFESFEIKQTQKINSPIEIILHAKKPSFPTSMRLKIPVANIEQVKKVLDQNSIKHKSLAYRLTAVSRDEKQEEEN